MGKKLEELLPSDKVMIELGAKTNKNQETGELDTIGKAKFIDVPYGFFLNATQDNEGNLHDEYNEKTGYVKTLNRTIKLVGMAGYKDQMTDRGETVPVPTVEEFETENSRAAAKIIADKAASDAKKAEEEAIKKAGLAEKAKLDFENKQAKDAQAEQQKREVAQKAADLAANKTPAQAKAIANAITESTDKVMQGIDDSGQASEPVTDEMARQV